MGGEKNLQPGYWTSSFVTSPCVAKGDKWLHKGPVMTSNWPKNIDYAKPGLIWKDSPQTQTQTSGCPWYGWCHEVAQCLHASAASKVKLQKTSMSRKYGSISKLTGIKDALDTSKFAEQSEQPNCIPLSHLQS